MFKLIHANQYTIFSVQIENHLVTQTVELMNHTNRIKSMIEMYNEDMVSSFRKK